MPEQGKGHEALPSITAPSSLRCPTEGTGLWRAGPLLASFCARSLSGMQLLLLSAGHSQGPEGGTARHGTAAVLAFSSARA